jgi:heat shock protein HslJ
MGKKYWLIIIGVLFVLGLVIFRSCQPAAAPDEPPKVPTLAPVNSITPTTKPLPTQTEAKPTTIPTMASSPTVKPKPTNTQVSKPKPTATTAPTQDPIQMVNWEWVSLKIKTTGEIKYIPDPKYYTIIFYPDGSVSGKADCNTFRGNYSTSNGYKINVTSTTRMACEPDSLETEYLNLLADIVAGGPDGQGGLALETAGGEKRMEFQNGGPAPK